MARFEILFLAMFVLAVSGAKKYGGVSSENIYEELATCDLETFIRFVGDCGLIV